MILSQDFRGNGSCLGNIFGLYKTRHILVYDSANCTVLCAVVLTQYRRVTDGRTDRQTDRQTDAIVVASTALAMRALVRAVIINRDSLVGVWSGAEEIGTADIYYEYEAVTFAWPATGGQLHVNPSLRAECVESHVRLIYRRRRGFARYGR